MEIPELRTVRLVRYLQPFREGGSLPALAEADDGFKYVIKFRGAGQGLKALIADLIGGLFARALGLHIPELVLAVLDESFGRTEPDEEIQDLLKASTGLNLGVHFLEGALTFDPAAEKPDGKTASAIVWLDAFLTNVDRTVKNTNLLSWHHELWLIDHGASLYFHHQWQNWEKMSVSPFPFVKDHVLLPFADQLRETDTRFRSLIDEAMIEAVLARIPDDWLYWPDEDAPAPSLIRDVYRRFLVNRLNHSEIFLKEALHARDGLL